MMSSCCTFRLKRRNAFSSGSPSCTRTSANELHLQTSQWGHFLEYGTLSRTSQGIPVSSDGNVTPVKWIHHDFAAKTAAYRMIGRFAGPYVNNSSSLWAVLR